MLLPDMNVRGSAHREDSISDHIRYAHWLSQLAIGPEPLAVSVLALLGLVRVETNTRDSARQSTLDEVVAFIEELVDRPTTRIVGRGSDSLVIFDRLCRTAGATDEPVSNTQHAAMAIEHRCTIVSTDANFARIPYLRWRRPLARSSHELQILRRLIDLEWIDHVADLTATSVAILSTVSTETETSDSTSSLVLFHTFPEHPGSAGYSG